VLGTIASGMLFLVGFLEYSDVARVGKFVYVFHLVATILLLHVNFFFNV
jgi:hypothetical protein